MKPIGSSEELRQVLLDSAFAKDRTFKSIAIHLIQMVNETLSIEQRQLTVIVDSLSTFVADNRVVLPTDLLALATYVNSCR